MDRAARGAADLTCFKNTLLGDAYYNLSAMPKRQLQASWEAGFAPPAQGGCPEVQPAKCEGSQCGDNRMRQQPQELLVESA